MQPLASCILPVPSQPPHASQVKEIVEVLVEALKTPSEPVQRSCGQCLAPLISRLASVDPTYSSELVDRLLEMAVSSEGYADRRGAAFGLGGLVRGLRLMSLKKMLIMDRLMERFESKKDVLGKEGALYAFGAFTGETSGLRLCGGTLTSRVGIRAAFGAQEVACQVSGDAATPQRTVFERTSWCTCIEWLS